jgi:hypothetical protein
MLRGGVSKAGRKPMRSLAYELSDWEVVEAYQMWDGTYAGAQRIAGFYGVSYRTLLRAFERMRLIWNEMSTHA